MDPSHYTAFDRWATSLTPALLDGLVNVHRRWRPQCQRVGARWCPGSARSMRCGLRERLGYNGA